MGMWLGNFPEDFATIPVPLTTHGTDANPIAPSSAFEAADFKIYKNGGETQKATTNGLTIQSPHDSIVGLHFLVIDSSNDTGDTGFWEAGAVYTVVADPDETVDSIDPLAVVGQFGIGLGVNVTHVDDVPVDPDAVSDVNLVSVGGNTDLINRFIRSAITIVLGTVGNGSTTTSIVTSALDPAAVDTDQFKDRIVIFPATTTTTGLRGEISHITGSSAGGVLTLSSAKPLSQAPVNGDIIVIV